MFRSSIRQVVLFVLVLSFAFGSFVQEAQAQQKVTITGIGLTNDKDFFAFQLNFAQEVEYFTLQELEIGGVKIDVTKCEQHVVPNNRKFGGINSDKVKVPPGVASIKMIITLHDNTVHKSDPKKDKVNFEKEKPKGE